MGNVVNTSLPVAVLRCERVVFLDILLGLKYPSNNGFL
jgi:hypothetical protein